MAYKILIIEDEADQAKPIIQMLEYRGYKVFPSQNGISGLAKAVELRPDLVIVDLLLVEHGDEADGYDVIEAIRNTPEIASIGIIAWTIHFVSGQHEIRALRVGADDFVRKDVEFGVLEARIERLLKRIKPSQVSAIVKH